MANADTILTLVREAVAARKSEGAERNAVTRVLARYGHFGLPKVEFGRTPSGLSIKVYRWVGAVAGRDLLLITGPSIEGEVRLEGDDGGEAEWEGAAEGAYVQLVGGDLKAQAKTTMKRIASQIEPLSASHRPKKTKTRAKPRTKKTAPKPKKQDEWVKVPRAPERERRRPMKRELPDDGVIYVPLLSAQDRFKTLVDLGHVGDDNNLTCQIGGNKRFVWLAPLVDGYINQETGLGHWSTHRRAKNWAAVVVASARARYGGLDRTFLDRGAPGYVEAAFRVGDVIEVAADTSSSRGRKDPSREFVRVLEINSGYALLQSTDKPEVGIKLRPVTDALTDVDACLENLESGTEDEKKGTDTSADWIEVPRFAVEDATRREIPVRTWEIPVASTPEPAIKRGAKVVFDSLMESIPPNSPHYATAARENMEYQAEVDEKITEALAEDVAAEMGDVWKSFDTPSNLVRALDEARMDDDEEAFREVAEEARYIPEAIAAKKHETKAALTKTHKNLDLKLIAQVVDAYGHGDASDSEMGKLADAYNEARRHFDSDLPPFGGHEASPGIGMMGMFGPRDTGKKTLPGEGLFASKPKKKPLQRLTDEEISQIASANFHAAIESFDEGDGGYTSVEDAIESYQQNAFDTVKERRGDQWSMNAVSSAFVGFWEDWEAKSAPKPPVVTAESLAALIEQVRETGDEGAAEEAIRAASPADRKKAGRALGYPGTVKGLTQAIGEFYNEFENAEEDHRDSPDFMARFTESLKGLLED